MFDKHIEDQILHWKSFRRGLETSADPLLDVARFWATAPLVNRNIDTYHPDTWPNPWQIISEKKYCEATIAIMMAHTISLTEIFGNDDIHIKVLVDSDIKAMYNVCTVRDKILNYQYREVVAREELPSSVFEQFSVPLASYK